MHSLFFNASGDRKVFQISAVDVLDLFFADAGGTVGIIPNQSGVYDAITKWCLPASLVLLLLSVDIKAIMHLGKTALAMMAVGAAGIMLGAPIVVLIYKQWLPPDAWMGIGALSASWIGGSANMIAVTAATNTLTIFFCSPSSSIPLCHIYGWDCSLPFQVTKLHLTDGINRT